MNLVWHLNKRHFIVIQEIQQVLSVTAVLQRGGELLQSGGIDISHAVGNLLDTGDLESLALFDRLDESRRLQQGFMRAGIQPGGAAPSSSTLAQPVQDRPG